MPFYAPSPTEVEFLIEKEGSFSLDQIHVSQVSWQSGSDYNASNNSNNGASYQEEIFSNVQWYDFVKCMRSVSEPLLTSHFGEGIIEEVFQRYSQIVGVSMLAFNQDTTRSKQSILLLLNMSLELETLALLIRYLTGYVLLFSGFGLPTSRRNSLIYVLSEPMYYH
ncbi:hypothetical protein Cgig2_001358 [Carnegiea gigantea]|uniref:Uncharacterized protein n=1 Tax=Carnegiea gigantea TaxID=171969 RepID=A0A9Q1KW73_9CARY|nr:hypothetical protein Cgig2_001358 [Carnegiea gigantea]